MGKEARLGLLLGASACLLAVMVDWVVEELVQPAKPGPGTSQVTCRVPRPRPPTPAAGPGAVTQDW